MKEILKLIATFVVAILVCTMLTECTQSLERNERNMVQIEEGYCYDADTKIIYIETDAGRYGMDVAYTPYYDEEGSLCKYYPYTGEWVPVKGGVE